MHFAEKRYSDLEGSTADEDAEFSLPHYFTLGFVWEKAIKLYLDNELVIGYYGRKELKRMELWIVRIGVEKKVRNYFAFRFGLTNPLIAKTSTLGDLRANLPNPKFSISTGCGFECKRVKLDLALFLNPGLSYVHRKLVPAIYLSGVFRY